MKYTVCLVALLVSLQHCRSSDDISLIFRGDSPFILNKTRIDIQEGKEQTITLYLSTQPITDIIVKVETVDLDTEGNEIDPASLPDGHIAETELDTTVFVFSPQSYNQPQFTLLRANDDCLEDSLQKARLKISVDPAEEGEKSDSLYHGNGRSLDISVADSDENLPRIVMTPPDGLLTSELGSNDFVQVRLSCAPTADVTVPVLNSAPDEVTIDRQQLFFTQVNYAEYQNITVTGINDCVEDADQSFTISTGDVLTDDERFNRYHSDLAGAGSFIQSRARGINENVALTNQILVQAVGESKMTDDGTDEFAVYNVALSCPVSEAVSLTFTGDISLFTVLDPSGGSMMFTPQNWSTSQLLFLERGTATAGNYTINIGEEDPGSAGALTGANYPIVTVDLEVLSP